MIPTSRLPLPVTGKARPRAGFAGIALSGFPIESSLRCSGPVTICKGMGKKLTPAEIRKLPAPAKRALKSGLTPTEAQFVAAYVDSGGKPSKAAKLMGKSPGMGSHYYNKPQVRAAILDEINYRAAGDAALARDVIRELAAKAESENVRLSAARELLNRGAPVVKTERKVFEFNLSPEERRERIQELQKEMGLGEGKVIEASYTEVEEPSSDGDGEEFEYVPPAPDTEKDD